jgi:hypothetical protein
MWPRVVEILIGTWLVASPAVLESTDWGGWQINDLVCGCIVFLLGCLSFLPATRYAHLGAIFVGAWMLGFAYVSSPYPAPAAAQNDVLVALFLMNFAVIPNQANLPPRSWREFVNTQFSSTAE